MAARCYAPPVAIASRPASGQCRARRLRSIGRRRPQVKRETWIRARRGRPARRWRLARCPLRLRRGTCPLPAALPPQILRRIPWVFARNGRLRRGRGRRGYGRTTLALGTRTLV